MRCSRFVGLALSIGLLTLAVLAQDKPPIAPRTTFKGHTEAIYSVAVDPGGKIAATGSFDKSVRLWDVASGKLIREYSGSAAHQLNVLSVTFHPKGDQIASGASDNTARVWDVPLSTPVREFAHTAGLAATALSADGKTIAAAGKDGTVRLWAVVDGKVLFTMTGHVGEAMGVAFNPNGQTVVSSGVDGTLRFWTVADGKPAGVIGAHAGPIIGLAMSPGNNQVYSLGTDGQLKYWQFPLVAPKPLPLQTDAITVLALSSDGAYSLTGGADKSLKIANAGTGAAVRDLVGATASVNAAAFSPNGALAAAGSADGRIHVWTVGDGKLSASVPAHTGGVTGVAFNPGGNGLVTVGADGAMRHWLLPLVGSKSFPQADRILAATLSTDGKRIVVAGADKVVRTLANPAGTAERQFAGHIAPVTAAALTPDNATLISVSQDETIRLWNAANGMPTASFAGHTGAISAMAVAPSGQFFATGGIDGLIKTWALPATPPKSFVHPDAVTSFVPSPDGNRVLTVAADKQARVWNLANPNAERAYTLAGQAITAVAYAADNVTVALAGGDRSLSIRNGDKEVKKITLPAVAQAIAFAPNGAAVAVGLADGTLRLFNVADGKELKNVPGHAGGTAFVAYLPKGDQVISAGADKAVRLWNAADLVAKGKADLPFVPTAAGLARDGAKLAVGGGKDVATITLSDLKVAGSIATAAEVRGVALAADGTRVAVAAADQRVRVYGPDTKLQEVFLHDGPAVAVAFHPDGKRLVSASADKSLRLWTPALIAQASASGPVRHVSIDPGSTRVVAVGDDKQVRIVDARTGKEQKAIPAGGAIVASSATSDFTKIATAGADKVAVIWSVADGKALVTVPLAGAAQAVALASNGSKLAVAFADGSGSKVRIFDGLTGTELQALPDTAAPVRSLAFLPDNRTVLVAGEDKAVALHDAAVSHAVAAHPGGVVAVYHHPGAAQAITAGRDQKIKLWDATAWKELKVIATAAEPIAAMAVSRDVQAVAVAGGRSARMWQLADGKEIANIPHLADATAISISPDRSRIATGAADGQGRLWDVKTGQLLQIFAHTGPIRGVAIHPISPTVVTASADKTAAIHTVAWVRTVVPDLKAASVLAMAPNGSLLVGGNDPVVRQFNASNGAEERKYEGSAAPIGAIAVIKNGQYVAVGGVDKTVRIYNANDGKEIAGLTAAAPLRSLAFSADGKMLIGAVDDRTVTAWNVAFQPGQPMPDDFGRVIQAFPHAEPATGVVVADKGEVFSAALDKAVRQWKVASNAPVRTFQHPNLVDAVAWSPDGKLLATACHDGILRVHDVEKQTVTKTINAHTTPAPPSPIYTVVWAAEGKQLVTASLDKSIKVWDAASGNLVKELKGYTAKVNEKGHTDQVFGVAVTKDGRYLISGSSDRKIKLWDVAAGTVVREFVNPEIKGEPGQSHPGGVYQLRLSPDEKTLISVGPAPRLQGYMAVWNVADGKMISGQLLPFGPIFGLATTPDGQTAILGCGPRVRQAAEAEAVAVPIPRGR